MHICKLIQLRIEIEQIVIHNVIDYFVYLFVHDIRDEVEALPEHAERFLARVQCDQSGLHNNKL